MDREHISCTSSCNRFINVLLQGKYKIKRIYLVGGELDNKISYYSVSTDTMHNTSDILPHNLLLLSQAYTQLGHSLYYTNEGDYTLHRFDCVNGIYDSTWQSTHDETFFYGNRDSPCMANDDRYIFLISGVVDTAAGNQMQIYDPIADVWTGGAALNHGRARSSCAVSPDKNNLYVFAGAHNGNSPPGNLE
eukprot:532207_1